MSDNVDLSAMSVDENFPIHRAYIIFRALGLRHLTVVDKHNVPIGMISRKELIGMYVYRISLVFSYIQYLFYSTVHTVCIPRW